MSQTTPDTSRQEPQDQPAPTGTSAQSDSAWDYVQDWDVEMVGPDVRDPEAQLRWSRAFCMAGGLPYIWRVLARPISEIVYSLLELREGDRVLVIGEAVEPAGWRDDMRQVVGEAGTVDVIEILPEARRNGKVRGRNGMRGCWQWTYTHDVADEHYDCVALLQSTQHCDDWRETGAEILRVMKPGRRAVFAEAVWGGSHFQERINADVHIREWVNKALDTLGQFEDVSQYTGEELKGFMGEMFDSPQCLEWRGIEMFWGRKPVDSRRGDD